MEIKITFDEKTLLPKLKFRVDELSDDNNEKLLKLFGILAKKNGIKIVSPTGGIGSDKNGKRFSYQDYEIIISK